MSSSYITFIYLFFTTDKLTSLQSKLHEQQNIKFKYLHFKASYSIHLREFRINLSSYHLSHDDRSTTRALWQPRQFH